MKHSSGAAQIVFPTVSGLIVLAIWAALTTYAPSLTAGVNIEFQSLNWVVPPLAAAGIAAFIVRRHIKAAKQEAGALVVSIPRRPTVIIDAYEISHFGVDWKVTIGHASSMGALLNTDPYAYPEGPYCPEDDYELDTRTQITLLGQKKHEWTCGVCHRKFGRPKGDLFHEDDVVGKIVMAKWRNESGG